MTHQRRIFWMALAAGFPGSFVALLILWGGDYTPKVQWTLTVLIVAVWWGFAFAARERTVLPLQTLANLLEALREGDYSIRARNTDPEDALGEVMVEVNALGEMLRSERYGALDAAYLLEQVIAEIDLAVFTFDPHGRLRLANRAAERMMAQPAERLLGRTAEELGLADLLREEAPRTLERAFPGQSGRWESRHSTFREGGLPHHLLVLSDLSKALREEERQAWQRLIRVLGHELNNSLAPIKSTAATVAGLLERGSPDDAWRADAQRGLRMIAGRCESLNRFVVAYSKLARLPAPRLRPTPVAPLVRRVAALSAPATVHVAAGPETTVEADPDQLEQLLINLVKNAAEAMAGAGQRDGPIDLAWALHDGQLEVSVVDRGPGISNPSNLFVPFFTTKPGGTGIGLVLCRQIAEAHGGNLELQNRDDARGCVARLRLPLGRAA